MMADISKPDFETRVAILQSKTREKSYPMTTDLLHAIAGAIQSNIRELEGALNKIIAYHQFKNVAPSIATIQPILASFTPTITKKNVTPRHLLETIATFYDITLEQIMGKSRERRFAFPRQIAMYLLREEIKCSFPAIGDHIGGRDHTTAMHACQKIAELHGSDDQLKRDLTSIRERLYSSSTS
jgi:chromosomal replication initiator protein